MHRIALTVALLTGCAGLSACATPQERAVDRENLLSAAGFDARLANTPERLASMRSLPPNKVVQRTRGGAVRYVHADPLVRARLYVGSQTTFGRHRQAIFQRRLADEQATTAQMYAAGWDERPWGPMW